MHSTSVSTTITRRLSSQIEVRKGRKKKERGVFFSSPTPVFFHLKENCLIFQKERQRTKFKFFKDNLNSSSNSRQKNP